MKQKKTVVLFLILSLVLIHCPQGSCKGHGRPRPPRPPTRPPTKPNYSIKFEFKGEVNPRIQVYPDDGDSEIVKLKQKGDHTQEYPDGETMFEPEEKLNQVATSVEDIKTDGNTSDEHCWISLNAKKLFEVMDGIDEQYEQERSAFHKKISQKDLDKIMLDRMIANRAASLEARLLAGGHPKNIPSGLNLGGYSMMRLTNSLLFFHRMKLRNDTFFRVNYLQTDVYNMMLLARISLNDLHLIGSYERAITDRDPSMIFYRPTYGEVELLLKNVMYKVEGRYRLVQGQLWVEHVLSEFHLRDVMMTYRRNTTENCSNPPEKLPVAAMDDFLARLKIDLDTWMKDYFNDELRHIDISSSITPDITKYEEEKAIALNDYVDSAVAILKKRLYSLKPPAANVEVPHFTIFAIDGIQIKLHNGVLRGLDSMYRQSVATGRKDDKIRLVDALLAFSNLKLEYKYLATLPSHTNSPPVAGLFVLSADELLASMGISMVKEIESVDLVFSYKNQTRPQALIVEGAVNRMIANFGHLLENQIVTLMLNTLLHQIKALGTLTKCEPSLIGHLDPGETESGGGGDDDAEEDLKLEREDSIEFEVPGKDNSPAKTMHLKYKEQLDLTEKRNAQRRMRKRKNKNKKKSKKSKDQKKKSRH